jgi:hypothetical protein
MNCCLIFTCDQQRNSGVIPGLPRNGKPARRLADESGLLTITIASGYRELTVTV